VASEDVVVQALDGAPEASQRPVGVQDDGTGSGEQHEAGNADEASLQESGTDRDAGQYRRQVQQRQREQGSKLMTEMAARPLTVLSVSSPAADSISNWRAAPAADPPGRMLLTAFPVSPAVTIANHALVRSARRWRPK
jgi:hypothetical protein